MIPGCEYEQVAFRSSGLAPSVGCDYFSLSPNFFLAQPGIALSSPIEYGLAVLGVVVDLDRWRRPQAQESSFSSFRPCVACVCPMADVHRLNLCEPNAAITFDVHRRFGKNYRPCLVWKEL